MASSYTSASPIREGSPSSPASSPETYFDAEQDIGDSVATHRPRHESDHDHSLSSNLSKIKFTVGDSEEDVSSCIQKSDRLSGGHHQHRHHKQPSHVKGASSFQPPPRDVKTCLEIYTSEKGAKALTDDEIKALVRAKHIPAYQLEKAVDDLERGVQIR